MSGAITRGARYAPGALPERLESRRLLSTLPVPRGGVITTSFGNGPDEIHALAVQRDRKIVAGGESGSDQGVALTLARYNLDGSLDPTFGTGGTVVRPLEHPMDTQVLHALAIDPGSEIIAAGEKTVPGDVGGLQIKMLLTRYFPDGTPDVVFDANVTPLGGVLGDVRSVAVQADGKILLVATSHPVQPANPFTVVRLNVDGTVDHTFGADGFVGTGFDANINDTAQAIVILPDGRIIIGGNAKEQFLEFGLIALNLDGSPNVNFGSGGKVISSVTDGSDILQSIAAGADGKIVAVGHGFNKDGFEIAEAARYEANGQPDRAFADTGSETVGGHFISDFSSAVMLADGSIVAAGGASDLNNINLVVTKLTPRGDPDPAFGFDGSTLDSVGGTVSRADAIALLPDGRIAAAGYYQGRLFNPAYDHFALDMLLPNGGHDDTFGVPCDINHSGFVDFPDLTILAQHYGKKTNFGGGDLNFDGKVGFDDLLIFSQNYGNASAKPAGQQLVAQLLDPRRRLRPTPSSRGIYLTPQSIGG